RHGSSPLPLSRSSRARRHTTEKKREQQQAKNQRDYGREAPIALAGEDEYRQADSGNWCQQKNEKAGGDDGLAAKLRKTVRDLDQRVRGKAWVGQRAQC